MPRALTRILKGVGYLLAAIIVLVLAGVGYVAVHRSLAIRAAREHMGPAAGALRVDGLAFRDLNKSGGLDPYEDWRLPVDARVDDLLARMTLEEKAGTLFQNAIFPGANGQVANALTPTNILPAEVALFEKKMTFFNLFLTGNAEQTARWLNAVQRLAERTRLGIPATISTDPRHSAITQKSVAAFNMREFSQWPEPLGLAALGDSTRVVAFGQAVAADYRALGIHVALHPMADLATEPRWARISGTFGEDAPLAARLVAAYVHGLQGDSLGPTSVAAVVKHFAGGGPQEDGWDPHFRYGKNQVYPGNNLAYHLIPFRAAIAAHAALMMPYYGVPVGLTPEDVGFNFNRQMVTDLLRDTLGFQGVVLTDWNVLTPTTALGVDIERFAPIAGAKNYGVEQLTPVQRAGKALDAGIDQFGGEHDPDYVVQLVRQGALPMPRLDASVRRLLALKFRLGLFENPYVDVARVATTVGTPEATRLADDAQRRSQVLLSDEPRDGTPNGVPILPLAPGTKIYVQGLDRAVAARYGTVVATPAAADVAILNLTPPFDEDRGSLFRQGRLYYTPDELEPVLAIARAKPTVVTFFLERPFVIPEIMASAQAVVANFGVTDHAVFDVLFGRARPEGKLPFDLPSSWASVLRQKPDLPFDAERPLFRFGYGLTYPALASDSVRSVSVGTSKAR